MSTLLQQASLPLRSRRQAHQVRITGVIVVSVGHASGGRQLAAPTLRGASAPADTCPIDGVYVPLLERAVWAKRALVAAIVVDVVALVVDGGQFSLIQKAIWGGVTMGKVVANDRRQQYVAWAQIAVLITAVAFFLRWFGRAYANAPLVSTVSPRWTPRWAVGYWLVPFISLVRPKQIANEIWDSANPDHGGRHGLVDLWWGAWIASNVLGYLTFNLSRNLHGLDDFRRVTEISLGADVVGVAARALAFLVVSRTTDRQHDQAIRHSQRAYV